VAITTKKRATTRTQPSHARTTSRKKTSTRRPRAVEWELKPEPIID